MKSVLFLVVVLFLSGCVGSATLISCATNSDQLPEKESYNLFLTASISTAEGNHTKSIPMQCTYKERRCGGGDWYFKWNETRDEELTFNLGQGKLLSVGAPNCTMALDYLGKNYPYGNSSILSNGQKFTISNEELAQSESQSILGAQLLSVSVSEVDNE
ncbi:MAG: hypothetical protein R3E62_10330 [Pseudomonadales bacterium]